MSDCTLKKQGIGWDRVISIETSEFHIRGYSLRVSEGARERQDLSRGVITSDDGADGGKRKQKQKVVQRWKRGRAGEPSISAPLITFSHLGI